MNGLPDLVIFNNRLGAVHTFPEEEVDALHSKGYYCVDDIITGECYEMRICDVKPVVVPKEAFNDTLTPSDIIITEAWRNHWSDEARKIDDSLTKFGVGSLFSRPVGDDAAYYVVTAVKRTLCSVEWRGFGSSSVDRLFGWGGDFRRKDVEPLCGHYPKVRLFGLERMCFYKTWKELEDMGLVPKGMCG